MASSPFSSPAHGGHQLRLRLLAHAIHDFIISDQPAFPHSFTLAPGHMSALAGYVLSNPLWADSPALIVAMLSFALVPTARPSPGLPALRQAAGTASQTGVCGKVWKEGELAYKCKTCERDPTCVVCVQCFKLADHTGHNYTLVRTQGGCCDCGDVQAWRPTGFCSVHSGACAEDEDPTQGMPPSLKTSLLELVSAIAHHILTTCAHLRIYKEKNVKHVNSVCVFLTWLTEIVSCGDGICRMVGLFLSSKPAHIASAGPKLAEGLGLDLVNNAAGFSWLAWMLAMDGMGKMPEAIQENLHEMYFQLITDLVFKRAFLEMFIENYERFVHAEVTWKRTHKRSRENIERQPKADIVANFTVQLFTVPALVPVMIRRGGLLDILIDMLGNLFETCASPVTPYGAHVPFEKSAFANETCFRTHGQRHVSEPVASSSTAPQPTTRRKRYCLPFPFATRDTRHRKALRRTRGASRSDLYPNDSRGTASTRDDESMTENREVTSPLTSSISRAGTVSQPEGDQAESQGPSVGEPQNSDAAVTSHGTQENDENAPSHVLVSMEVHEDDVEIVQDPDAEDTVLLYIDEGVDVMEEENDGDGEMAELFTAAGVVPNLTQAEGRTLFLDQSRNTYSRLLNNQHTMEQLSVLEDGMHFAIPKSARLGIPIGEGSVEDRHTSGTASLKTARRSTTRRRRTARPVRTSPYLSAVQEARRMECAAIHAAGPLAHPMRLDFSMHPKSVMEWVRWRMKIDLKYILNHRAVTFHLVHEREDLFRKFVRIISMAQGMHPSPRRFGDHIPFERGSWTETFTMEIELIYQYVELLSEAFCASHIPRAQSAYRSKKAEADILASSRLRCIAVVRSCLDEWIEREKALEARSTYASESFSISHSISVHLPLHRLLSFMVYHVLRLDGPSLGVALSGGVGETSVEDARGLLRHPLRVQAFLAQVRSGMWRRNGLAVAGQSVWYRFTHFSEWFMDLDLFLQQCCACIIGPDIFIQDLLEAFRIADFSRVIKIPKVAAEEGTSPTVRRPSSLDAKEIDEIITGMPSKKALTQATREEWSAERLGLYPMAPRAHDDTGQLPENAVEGTGNTLSELADFIPTILEDVLSLLVCVMSERSRCGLGKAEFLRRKLVHQLSSEDKTHSELYMACSFRISMDLDSDDDSSERDENSEKAYSLVESILPKIADYIEPRGLAQGKYRLKESVWDEFDPFCPHMSLRDKHAAEIRHAGLCERMNRRRQVISIDNVHERIIFPQLRKVFALSLETTRNAGVASELLSEALPRNGGPRYLEGCLPAALSLICAAAEMPAGSLDSICSDHWLNSSTSSLDSRNSALSAVCTMYNVARESDSNPFSEYLPVLARILDRLKQTGRKAIQEYLNHSLNLTEKASGSSESHSSSEGPLNQNSERRKLILRRQKENQAAVLAQMRLAQESFAEHLDDTLSRSQGSSDVAKTMNGMHHTRGSGSGRDDIGPSSAVEKQHVGRSDTLEHVVDDHLPECALCHETGRGDGTRLMGLIGFHQKTRLPAIALAQCKDVRRGSEEVARVKSEKDPTRSEARPYDTGGGAESNSMDIDTNESDSNLQETRLRQSFFLNSEMLKHGVASGQNLHIAFCGHSIHIQCFDRYSSSLMQSRAGHSMYEGINVLDLDKLEFLCPVCRRLANMVLPIMNDLSFKSQAPISRSTKSDNSPVPFVEWLQACDVAIRGGPRGRGDAFQNGVNGNDGTAMDAIQDVEYQKGEIASTVHALRFSIINSGKAVLHKFGLQSFRSTSYGKPPSGDAEKDVSSSRSYAKLPSAAISTVACAEIAARGGWWYGSASQLARKSLRKAIMEARAQISLEPEARRQGLQLLWREVRSADASKGFDPFASFAFLFLLYDDGLSLQDAKNLVRMGFNLIRSQSSDLDSKGCGAKVATSLNILLYLRRACLMISSCFSESAIGLIKAYGTPDSSPNLAKIRMEIQDLLSYLDIPAPTELLDGITNEALNVRNMISLKPCFRQQRIGLIRLPELFQSLLEDLDGMKCSSCKGNPTYPALCLVCGDLFCTNGCKPEHYWLKSHPRICGAGIGIFLMLKATGVQIIRNRRASLWSSPYLDAHGEEDKNLIRGRPLFLNEERYSALERLWLTHGFDQDSRILSTTEPVQRVIMRANQML